MASSASFSVSQCLRISVVWLLFTWAHCLKMTCIDVKKVYAAEGFDESEVPFYAVTGE